MRWNRKRWIRNCWLIYCGFGNCGGVICTLLGILFVLVSVKMIHHGVEVRMNREKAEQEEKR